MNEVACSVMPRFLELSRKLVYQTMYSVSNMQNLVNVMQICSLNVYLWQIFHTYTLLTKMTAKKSYHLSLKQNSLKAPIPTKVVYFSRLLKCLRSLYGKQCGPRSDCSYRSSLIWVHPVYFYTLICQ